VVACDWGLAVSLGIKECVGAANGGMFFKGKNRPTTRTPPADRDIREVLAILKPSSTATYAAKGQRPHAVLRILQPGAEGPRLPHDESRLQIPDPSSLEASLQLHELLVRPVPQGQKAALAREGKLARSGKEQPRSSPRPDGTCR